MHSLKPHVKCADGTTGGSVCIVLYTKFNGFLCTHKSVYFLYLQRSLRLCNTVLNIA